MKSIRIYLIGLAIFLISGNYRVGAQTKDAIPQSDSTLVATMSEVVVSANRVGSVLLETPESIQVARAKSIHRSQLRTAPEALMQTPGVFVQKTNHGGGSAFIRGLTGNQTLMLIDGIRLSNATVRSGPNQYFNTINVFGLDRIEVLAGSGSVQYGSDAIGGTIQAFSKKLKFSDRSQWGGDLVTRFGSQGMEKTLSGNVNHSGPRLAFSGGATWRDFGDIVGGDTTGRQDPSGYRELDFDFKAKGRISETADLTVLYQRVHQRRVPVYHKVELEDFAINRMNPQRRELAYIRLHKTLDLGVLKSILLNTSMQKTEEGRELLKNGSSSFRVENDKVSSISFTGEARTSRGRWSANTGVEIYNDKVRSTRTDHDLDSGGQSIKRGLYPDRSMVFSLAAFSIHDFDFNKWKVTAGGRFTSYVNTVNDPSLGETRLTPKALVGNLALLRRLASGSNLFASINTGFRAPNIDDLGTLGIVDFRYETPNFDLKPEYSTQFQLGYKHERDGLRGEVYLYHNQLSNLIVRSRVEGDSIEGYPVYEKENAGSAFIQGLETGWEWDLAVNWTLSGSATYTYGENATNKEPLRRIPPLFGRMGLQYTFSRWIGMIEWQAAGSQDRLSGGDIDDNRIPDGGTPGWNVLNAGANYDFGPGRIDISVLNLFNKDYRLHGSGINGYGRSIFVSLNLQV